MARRSDEPRVPSGSANARCEFLWMPVGGRAADGQGAEARADQSDDAAKNRGNGSVPGQQRAGRLGDGRGADKSGNGFLGSGIVRALATARATARSPSIVGSSAERNFRSSSIRFRFEKERGNGRW